MKFRISASLACANPINIQHDFDQLEKTNIDAYHIDLCDGVFAPTFLLSSALVKTLRPLTKKRLDVHIYGHHPTLYLEDLKASGADVVIVQVETQGENYLDAIQKIRTLGMLAGIGILPTSNVNEEIHQVLPFVSVVVTNTVGPAYSGQPFNPQGLVNMKKIKNMMLEMGLSLEIIADGGVTKNTLPDLLKAGANHFVLGTSALFNEGGIQENARFFYHALKQFTSKIT